MIAMFGDNASKRPATSLARPTVVPGRSDSRFGHLRKALRPLYLARPSLRLARLLRA